jgi:hypothetical protein
VNLPTLASVVVVAVVAVVVVRRIFAPRAGTRRLAMLVWASFAPYDDAEFAEESLHRACDVVFGSQRPPQHEEWIQSLIRDLQEWQRQGRLETATKRLRRWLVFDSYGEAFSAARYAFRMKLMNRAEEIAGSIGTQFPNVRELLDAGLEKERQRLADEGKKRFDI